MIAGGVKAARPVSLEPIRPRTGNHARSPRSYWSGPPQGDPAIELLSPTEALGARGAAAIARDHIVLPEREGVDER